MVLNCFLVSKQLKKKKTQLRKTDSEQKHVILESRDVSEAES